MRPVFTLTINSGAYGISYSITGGVTGYQAESGITGVADISLSDWNLNSGIIRPDLSVLADFRH